MLMDVSFCLGGLGVILACGISMSVILTFCLVVLARCFGFVGWCFVVGFWCFVVYFVCCFVACIVVWFSVVF